MMRRVFVFIFSLVFSIFLLTTALASGKKHIQAKIRPDSSKIEVKKISDQAIEKFNHDKDFDYREGTAYDMSAWTRFWAWVAYIIDWLWSKIKSAFISVPGSATFLKYLLLAIAIGFVVYIVLKSLGIDVSNLWRRESKKIQVPFTESLEDIHGIDFDSEIEKAISQHNYRLGVRLLYLKCLKQLSDGKLITWQIDKTNAAYLYELTDAEQKQTFSSLTKEFEYIWYGNFSIDQKGFNGIYQLFQDFKKQIL
ncbi:hypothetical protein [Mucilaginibacter gotjawali]|uniref:Uncharacterized protein n=2 Tax=Mucilaginibacter gotjawali TaxID=1550579 RepID=A0A0X8X5L8_9SPHI|nr:hypothetical protein [Mucilaginibacter gotjawali]MBB3055266.1 hypothetical protein [Mucilaginibacter gotjawali]BAU56115.1 hypothetical protein MgSA37_04312 [Mucilaginibacter gotjawali]